MFDVENKVLVGIQDYICKWRQEVEVVVVIFIIKHNEDKNRWQDCREAGGRRVKNWPFFQRQYKNMNLALK